MSTQPCESSSAYRLDAGFAARHGAVIGLDEAGRGPLAGPVVAAAVQLDPHRPIEGINDSKKLSATRREALYDIIMARAVDWAVASATVEEIETLNILNASLLAMQRAIDALRTPWNLALVDGNRPLPHLDATRQRTMVGGDGLSAAIGAASILAKVTRDREMCRLHDHYPQYGFNRHKGYGTRLHISALCSHGLSPVHRRSFCEHFLLQTTLDLTVPTPDREAICT